MENLSTHRKALRQSYCNNVHRAVLLSTNIRVSKDHTLSQIWGTIALPPSSSLTHNYLTLLTKVSYEALATDIHMDI